MPDVTPPIYPPPPPPPEQRFPTWKQALVLFGGGAALAISACFGCLFTLASGGRPSPSLEGLSILLGILAFAGLLGSLVGVVLVLIRILRALFTKKEQKDQAPS
jgi:hypothetical protein